MKALFGRPKINSVLKDIFANELDFREDERENKMIRTKINIDVAIDRCINSKYFNKFEPVEPITPAELEIILNPEPYNQYIKKGRTTYMMSSSSKTNQLNFPVRSFFI